MSEPRHDYSEKPLRPPPGYQPTHTAICPQCEGHGGWKSKYGPIGCYQCYGWGYVDPNSKSALCIHEFEEVSAPPGNRSGIHVDRCKICGHEQSRDTSD